MAGLQDIAGGSSGWGGGYGLYPLAQAMVGADTQAAPMQQGYYPNNALMPGAMQAWQDMGVPPVMYHPNSPYATLAYRTTFDPFGQMAVQPLTGFPSVYPHVLPGVAPNPFQTMFPMLQAMMPPMMPLQWGAMRQPKRGGGGVNTGGTAPGKTAPAQPNPLAELQKSAAALNTGPARTPFVGPPAPTGQAPFVGPPAPSPTYIPDDNGMVIDTPMINTGYQPALSTPAPVYNPVPIPDNNGMVIDTPMLASDVDWSQYIPTTAQEWGWMGDVYNNIVSPPEESDWVDDRPLGTAMVGPLPPRNNPVLRERVADFVRNGDTRSPLRRAVDNYIGENRGQLSLPVQRPLVQPAPVMAPVKAPSALLVGEPIPERQETAAPVVPYLVGEPAYDYMADYAFAPEPVYDTGTGVLFYPDRIRELTGAR